MHTITPNQLVMMNQRIISDDSYIPTKDDMNQIEEITRIPYELNEELFYVYKGTVEKAAKLGHLIVRQKPFESANTETAILAVLTLLEINGYQLVNYKADIDELCARLEEPTIDGVCRWIHAHREDEGYNAF